jgi:Phosphoribulokinase / Uridine kinase family
LFSIPCADINLKNCFDYLSILLINLLLDRTVEAPTSRLVIIEGIYALSEKLRPLLDLRVSVTGGVHFDLVKRVLRDIQRAGQEPEEIIQQISETVLFPYNIFSKACLAFFIFNLLCTCQGNDQFFIPLQVYPMYKAFIEPDLQTAHIKIVNKFNPFSGFQNPTYILKVYWLSSTLSLSLSLSRIFLCIYFQVLIIFSLTFPLPFV